MTKEEIVQTISDDKMMPFIQTGQLVEIVDFVIKNYTPSLSSDLDDQEQPEVDLEKEYIRYMDSRKDDLSGNAVTVNMKDLARHFYELGQRTKYQQIRAEFAKPKAKECQDGNDEGCVKGFNARKEESVGVAESPLKTFPRVNEFDCGSSYRH